MIDQKENHYCSQVILVLTNLNFNYFTTIAKQVLTTYKYLPLAPMLAQGDH